jgi:Domain of unknown function (DUF4260)
MLTRPSVLLRIEEAALLVLAVFLYQRLQYSWFLFTILFFAPDLFMLGYLINPSLGAATYNLVHTPSGSPSRFYSQAISCTGTQPPPSLSSGSPTSPLIASSASA